MFLTFSTVKLMGLSSNWVSRTTVFQHYAINHNQSDISNTYNLQNNIAVLIGNLIGLCFSLGLPHAFMPTMAFLLVSSFLSVITSFKSIKYIQLSEFNLQRLFLLSDNFLKVESEMCDLNNIITPEEATKREKLLFSKCNNIYFCNTSPEILIKETSRSYTVQLFDLFKSRSFFVFVKKSKITGRYKFYTFLKVNAESLDILIAFMFTIRLKKLINKQNLTGKEIIKLYERNFAYFDAMDKKAVMDRIKHLGWKIRFNQLEETYSRYHMLFKSID